MLDHIGYKDRSFADELIEGLKIAGPIAPSKIWPKDDVPASKTIDEFLHGAWAYRAKLRKEKKFDARIFNRPPEKGGPITYTEKIWEDTIEEVKGSAAGKFMQGPLEEEEVSRVLRSDRWVPIWRFPVLQKNKLRPCDDGADSGLNATTSRSEKLVCSSVDQIGAAIRLWKAVNPAVRLGGWAIDEAKAYRQIPIRPDHRRFAVVAALDPKSGKIKYFIMNSHSFGFTAAVYNYNRRSLSIHFILNKIFRVPTDYYFDDRFGFKRTETVQSSFETVVEVNKLLGVSIEDSKAQGPEKQFRLPEILGVEFDLDEMMIRMKESRKVELLEEISEIERSGTLLPGHAGKLKGKLMFGASQLYGKLGRAALRSISERQYEVRAGRSAHALTPPIKSSFKIWKKLIQSGRPRTILSDQSQYADAFFFTDASTGMERIIEEDGSASEQDVHRVGGVLFAWWMDSPKAFGIEVPARIVRKWLPRKTQINQLEMMATVIMIHHFRHDLANKRVIGMIDSESALGGLVKGYSKFSDVSELVAEFWGIAADHGISLYLDRVSTDMNISDEVSRGSFKIADECGWEMVTIKIPNSISSTERDSEGPGSSEESGE